MLPFILAGAAALLLGGCTHEGESPPPQSPEGNSPPDPDDSEENYRILFKSESLAGESYEELRRAGVKLKALDHGCHTIDFTKDEPNGEHKNLTGKIETCEVFEYILDHSQKFRSLAVKLANGALPWELDDQNPATDFDVKVRAKVQSAIDQVKTILRGKGLSPNSPEYQEKLAVALFYFVVYPVDPTQDPGVKNWQNYGKKELYSLGLENFHEEFLLKQGGLGRMTVKGFDQEKEYSALDTLKNNEGWCTEWSKVLYGVHQMAGLRSFFATTRIDPKTLSAEIASRSEVPSLDHIFLELPLGNRTRFFDVSRYNSDIQYSRYYRYHLLHYLSDDFSNRGVDHAKNQKNDAKAVTALQRSLELNPDNYISNYNLGVVLVQQVRITEALSYLERATQVDPSYAPAFEELGYAYAELKQNDKAIKSLIQKVRLSPEEIKPLLNLGIFYLRDKKTLEALQTFHKALKLDPNSAEAYEGLGAVFFIQDNFGEAKRNFEEAVRLDPQSVSAHLKLGILYYSYDKIPEARKVFAKVLELDPNNSDVRKFLKNNQKP